ncbi:MAG: Uncharacterised protein [Synechococcus sp. CC9902]|nr:MAG: Uncharacterised protein [Synechococcus sp. CC9902]
MLASIGQVVAQSLQPLPFLLMLACLTLQLTAAGLEACQLRLDSQQLIFPKSLDLLLKGCQNIGGLGELLTTAVDGLRIPLLLGFESLLTAGEILECLLGRLKRKHHFLAATKLHPFAQLLVLPGLGTVLFQSLSTGQKLLLDDPTALLAFLNVVELALGLINPAVEEGDTRQFVDQAAAVAVAHRHDAGHIALHHNIASLRIDAQSPQLGLQLLQVAGHAIGAVAGAVRPTGHHPQFAGHRPFGLSRFDPRSLFRRFKAFLGCIGLPVAEIETNADAGLGRFAGFQHPAVHKVRQAIGTHASTCGQAKTEQNTVEDVAFSRPVGACHHGESLFKRDGHRSTERLEMRQPNLIDVDQQERGLSAG